MKKIKAIRVGDNKYEVNARELFARVSPEHLWIATQQHIEGAWWITIILSKEEMKTLNDLYKKRKNGKV